MQRSAIAETEQAKNEIADEFFIGDRLALDVDASSQFVCVKVAGPPTVYTEPLALERFKSRQSFASARSRQRDPDQYGSSQKFEASKKNKKANCG
jgi:hypothetical protein